MSPAGRVVLGQILGAIGVRGELRVRYFGDGPENFLRLQQVWVGVSARGEDARPFEVRAARRARPGEVRLALAQVDDREAAAALREHFVLADAAELEELPPGEYYWHQLVGCRVEDSDGAEIGVVREIWETGAHDVLVVEAPGGRRHLLPAAASFLREVDLAGRRIEVELIPGLLDSD
jgi:16S rRNA processing protein RimM